MMTKPAEIRVLLVEDEALIALDFEDMLTRMGCSVMSAATVGQAFTLLDRDKPDFAILDVNLGGKLSTPVAERLRAGRVPFAFVTAYGPDRLSDPVLESAPLLSKPLNPNRLRYLLRDVPAGPDAVPCGRKEHGNLGKGHGRVF